METDLRSKCVHHEWKGVNWMLHPQRGMYWKELGMLLIADAHLGKIRHFQKSGIPIPGDKEQTTYRRMDTMIRDFEPDHLVFLGDLFHSSYNEGWEAMIKWAEKHSKVQFHLIKGNHDILQDNHYEESGFRIHEESWVIDDFMLTHDPTKEVDNVCRIGGHVHPGVKLKGKGRKKLRLPCFFFDSQKCILPAVGYFTGLAMQEVNKEASVFVTTGRQVLKI